MQSASLHVDSTVWNSPYYATGAAPNKLREHIEFQARFEVGYPLESLGEVETGPIEMAVDGLYTAYSIRIELCAAEPGCVRTTRS